MPPDPRDLTPQGLPVGWSEVPAFRQASGGSGGIGCALLVLFGIGILSSAIFTSCSADDHDTASFEDIVIGGQGVTITVDDPARRPQIYVTSFDGPVHFTCEISPPATLVRAHGPYEIVDGKGWELVLSVKAPTAGDYEFECNDRGELGAAYGVRLP